MPAGMRPQQTQVCSPGAARGAPGGPRVLRTCTWCLGPSPPSPCVQFLTGLCLQPTVIQAPLSELREPRELRSLRRRGSSQPRADPSGRVKWGLALDSRGPCHSGGCWQDGQTGPHGGRRTDRRAGPGFRLRNVGRSCGPIASQLCDLTQVTKPFICPKLSLHTRVTRSHEDGVKRPPRDRVSIQQTDSRSKLGRNRPQTAPCREMLQNLPTSPPPPRATSGSPSDGTVRPSQGLRDDRSSHVFYVRLISKTHLKEVSAIVFLGVS